MFKLRLINSRLFFLIALILPFFVDAVEKENLRNVNIPSNVLGVQMATQQSSNQASLKSALGLGMHDGLLLKQVRTDKKGNTHAKYQQLYKGIPVLGESIALHQSASGRVKASGFVIKGLDNTNLASTTSYALSQIYTTDDALNAALQHRGHHGNNWNIRGQEVELVIYLDQGLVAHPAYKVSYVAEHLDLSAPVVQITQPIVTRPFIILSKEDLSVLKEWEGLAHAKVGTGPGGNIKTGAYEYGTDFDFLDVTQTSSNCTLESQNVKTVNLNHGYTGESAFSFTCPRNTTKPINGAYSPLNDAHFFGNVVFDMFQTWLDVSPLSFKLVMRVHYGQRYENAFWDGSTMTFGDGDNTFYPLVDINIAAHEVAHGFTEQNSNLRYYSQSGGINESFSDITGEAAEYFLKGTVDWFAGGDVMKHDDGLRYFEDPTQDGRSIGHASDYYSGMDVHFSSGVFNRAFYIISNTPGWTVRKAFEIFAHANMYYWGPNETFNSGACGVLESARDLNLNTVHVNDAFQTVGVDCGYMPFTDSDLDGMDDFWEQRFGLNPADSSDAALDLDNDGLTNLQEFQLNTLPNDSDTDDDLLSDGLEVNTHGTNPAVADSDNDGLTDYEEITLHATNPLLSDSDLDQLLDAWEVLHGLNPLQNDALLDGDGDGLTNLQEQAHGGNPRLSDTDQDGLLDGIELELGTLLNNADSDDDGLNDGAEVDTHRTNPLSADTDEDGMDDSFEVSFGLNPLSSDDALLDLDGDGISNLEEYIYSTDPSDPNSKPEFQIVTFENGKLPVRWEAPFYADFSWNVDQSEAYDGHYSLSPEVTDNSITASIAFTSEFKENSFSFWFKTQSESCCDYLEVLVDGQIAFFINGTHPWTQQEITITEGRHTISFNYTKDGYRDEGDGRVWIDGIRYVLPDEDQDGMPNEWEELYGLDPFDADDALLDNDTDGLSNLIEYVHDSNPLLSDSDEDGLSDFDEVTIYLTFPSRADSDQDGIPDGFEVEFALDPTNDSDANADTDSDGFSNLEEYQFGSNPLDSDSKPSLQIYSFESGVVPGNWTIPADSEQGWEIDSSIDAHHGEFALKSKPIAEYQTAGIEFTSDFMEGTLSFWSKTSSESCCDHLYVYVDDVRVLRRSGEQGWVMHELDITTGIHTLRFEYYKDGSVDRGADSVWIDYLRFIIPDADSDGMSDAWEELYELDKNDPSDAMLDADNDGLSNLREFELTTNPRASDTDNDGLIDFYEVQLGTSPSLPDTDSDGMNDGYELENHFDPLSQRDGNLDADGDGYTNTDEFLAGTDPRNVSSKPSYQLISFTSGALDAKWSTPEASYQNWQINRHESQHLSGSIQARSAGSSSRPSIIEFTDYFGENDFSFWTKITERYGYLRVYVDGVAMISMSNAHDWSQQELSLTAGQHVIRFEYYGYYTSSDDTIGAFIDNIRYTVPDTDQDGLPDAWEIQYGLDVNDPSDALQDSDGDALTNLDEYTLGTNPQLLDSDSDGLEDGAEVNLHSTDPLLSDTDGDGITDGLEIDYSLDPTNSADAFLDLDGDGYATVDELAMGTDPLSFASYPEIRILSFASSRLNRQWTTPDISNKDWELDKTVSQHLFGSLKAENSSTSSVRSVIEFTESFAEGELSFWTKMERSCCSYLYIYVDGVRQLYISSQHDWTTRTLNLTEGRHTIRFEFTSSSYSNINRVWIDHFRYRAVDADNDGMSDLWEDLYGFNKTESSDAILDFDSDTLSNLQEYLLDANPASTDTDDDGLSDSEELNTYKTSVNASDTDFDGLPDGFEITHGFDPHNNQDALLDSDGDGFINLDEYIYGTDPLSFRNAPSVRIISFEDGTIPSDFSVPSNVIGGWEVDSENEAQHGVKSLRASPIDHSQTAEIVFQTWFAGDVSFWSKTSSESCCDYLRVYVNDELKVSKSGIKNWEEHHLSLEAGTHEIRFVYYKDGSVDTALDTVWIDNIRFVAQDQDGDGIADYWEDLYGLDKTDPSDADADLDSDGLTNYQEFILQTSPLLIDTDGDGITDAEEYLNLGTNPSKSDSDDDGVNDNLDAFPLNEAASLDADNDSFPDEWNGSCNQSCQDESGLSLDISINDIDNDGLSDDQDNDNGRDNLGPQILLPRDITVPAAGLETSVDLGLALAIDFVDGPVLVQHNSSGIFTTGHHVVQWTATDSAGNTTVAYQNVNILPLVNFKVETQQAEEGDSVVVQAILSGAAPAYPVIVPYIIRSDSSAKNPSDHNAVEGFFIFNEGEASSYEAAYEFATYYEDVVAGEPDETIIFELVGSNGSSAIQNAAIGEMKNHTVIVLEINERPQVSITILEGATQVTQVSNGATITVDVSITDPNPEDQHQIEWSINGEELSEFSNQRSFELSTDSLEEGENTISVLVYDNGTPVMSASSSNVITKVTPSSPKGGALSFLDFLLASLLVTLYRFQRQSAKRSLRD